VISRELAEDVGIAGPLLRGSNVAFDIRRSAPYSSYEDFTFTVPVETAGDCFSRYRVRMLEFRESIAIVRQVLDRLPEGPSLVAPGTEVGGPDPHSEGRSLRARRGSAR
jgi:NADH-quinone oxidoreductase subunit D